MNPVLYQHWRKAQVEQQRRQQIAAARCASATPISLVSLLQQEPELFPALPSKRRGKE
jgi:hypothetical protein